MSARQRDPGRTRQALLDATARVVAERGAGVTLDAVAQAAGVSKGGLLHHFRSREALFVGLVEASLSRFDAAVQRHLDPTDDRPGHLTRAYIRGNLDPAVTDLGEHLWRNPTVLAELMSTPAVRELTREADRRWRRRLEADGLHPQRTMLISGALDGRIYGQLLHSDADHDDELKDLLLALTETDGPITGPAGVRGREAPGVTGRATTGPLDGSRGDGFRGSEEAARPARSE
ncbi:MAG: TetR/AcrR family transcriptional regulator [Nocardioides sp.]